MQAFSGLTERYHEALAKMLFDTDIYLKVPSTTRLGREFTIYVDPMGAPGKPMPGTTDQIIMW